MSHSEHAPRDGVSRRRFLQGAGTAAVGSALLGAPVATRAQEQTQPARAGIRRYAASGQRITLQVNGQPRQVFVTPDTTLLQALREEMDLIGAKDVCDRGACGACTVLIDGQPVNSCMTLALDAIGQPITTVEGLADDGRLDPVQQAFIEHDAAQCGYCTPGFVVTARALLNETPHPSREQIRDGLCGNICRCGAYVKIIEAVEAAAGAQGAAAPAASPAQEVQS